MGFGDSRLEYPGFFMFLEALIIIMLILQWDSVYE
jgi:hypothetical protein